MEPSEHTPEEVRKVAEFGFDRDRFHVELRTDAWAGWVVVDNDGGTIAPLGDRSGAEQLAWAEARAMNAGRPSTMIWVDDPRRPL